MVTRAYPSPQMLGIQSETQKKYSVLIYPSPPQSSPTRYSSPPPPSSYGSKISPAILFIIIILAVMVFIAGLLHLLVRFLIKKPSSATSQSSHSNRYAEMSSSDVLRRQLQQLFHLHDSGLDQAYIDALPVFLYKEIMGLKEPFDCAVCLCEFAEEDKLRLLPLCSHAFHIDCIDTWLLSNSTCPLCRGTLFVPGLGVGNPMFGVDLPSEVDGRALQGDCESGFSSGEKPVEVEELVGGEKKVYHVRLGNFKNANNVGGVDGVGEKVEAETSSKNLDARRCYSMGSFQYVVPELDLQVALTRNKDASGNLKFVRRPGVGERHNVKLSDDVDLDGKNLRGARKGESFSVSKIWLWSRKGNYLSSSNTRATVLNKGFPLTARTPNSSSHRSCYVHVDLFIIRHCWSWSLQQLGHPLYQHTSPCMLVSPSRIYGMHFSLNYLSA